MQPYKNLSGDSGVVAYEIGDHFIEIQFKRGAPYRYTDAGVGRENVERMKKLAGSGNSSRL